ncbi:ribonuclease H-like domain-containing protein [Tanacetum coccineum]|uniref:Ribonuclease H-like domain-containing protein n=1 Tax=Tanacetum coccineum TaxID=301880 RepID=A0ABQ5EFQ8_9ASTR
MPNLSHIFGVTNTTFVPVYANNKGKEILKEHWKEVFCECDQAEEGLTNFALMAYSSTSSNSEVSTDSNCLEPVEARLLVYKKNESVYEEDMNVLKCEIHLRQVAITVLKRKLELAQKQKDEIQLTVENFENSSKNLNKLIDCQIVDKCKTSLGYNAVPPPYTGNFMPPKPDLSFSGLEEFTSEPIVFYNEEDDVPQAKIEKKTFKPSFAKIEFVKSKQQDKTARKTVNHRVNTVKDTNVNIVRPKAVVNTVKLKSVVIAAWPNAVVNVVKGNNVNAAKASAYYEEIDGGYVAFGGNPKGGKITSRGGLTCLFRKATSDESELWHRRLGHINFKTMNKLVKRNLIKDRLKVARDRQKSYADKRRKPLEFSVEGRPSGLSVRLPEELNGVHDAFHVSNYKKCLGDPTLLVPLDEIRVDAKLNFMEEPMEILEREFKKLKRSRISIVKVWWNSKRRPEFMWEREDQMKFKYPHLFSADK